MYINIPTVPILWGQVEGFSLSRCDTRGKSGRLNGPGFNIVPSKQQSYAEALGKECWWRWANQFRGFIAMV